VKERVQKLLAQADLGSRRSCEELIRQGRVQVNNEVVTLGAKADPEKDVIKVDGKVLRLANLQKIYIALNKPINVLSTDAPHKSDPRSTVRDLVPVEGHLFTIGRLDADSQGLMVLTNDGELANRLSHPRYRHTKTYRVTVYGLPTAKALQQWREGIYLADEGMTAPCSVQILKTENGLTVLEVIMTEGKKRQIRRIASELGYPVRYLLRTHIGQLSLGTLRPGEWRELTPKEVNLLRTPNPIIQKLRAAQRSARQKGKYERSK
jgi:pseudouridine synthase